VHHEIERALLAEDQRPAMQRTRDLSDGDRAQANSPTSPSAATRSKWSYVKCLTRSAGSRSSCSRIAVRARLECCLYCSDVA
jgi:hypothetical protein